MDITQQESRHGFETYNGFAICADTQYSIQLTFHQCPNCQKISSFAKYVGSRLPEKIIPLYPSSLAIQFPDYVPEVIRNDYEEAYAIVSASPKASATLSRRCLQGMIRDFWGISKSTLYEEILSLKDKIPAEQWKVIDALRRIGNIGAHMERDINYIVDIEPGEAEKLLKLIEHLIQQWYIKRHEQETLYNEIISIGEDKHTGHGKTE